MPAPSTADAAYTTRGELSRVTMRKVTRRLLPFLFLLYVVNYLDRVNVSFAALGMNPDLQLSATQYGLGAGLFFWGYVLCQVPANLVMMRVGARRWIATLLLAWGIAASCMALIQGRTGFYALRVVLGVAEAGFFPGIVLYLSHWFPASERARAVGRFMLAIPVAAIVGGPLSGALLGLHGVAGIAGWRWLFLLEALPAIALGFVTLRYLTNEPRHAHWLAPEERDWLETALRHESTTTAAAHHTVWTAMRDPKLWTLAATAFMSNVGAYGVTLWLPQVLQARTGGSPMLVGVLSTIPGLTVIVAVLYVSAHSDRSGERCLHCGLSWVLAAAGLALAATSNGIVPTVAGLSLALAGFGAGSYGPFWSLPSCFLRGPAAAVGVAFINAISNMGGFAGPYLLGATKDRTGDYSAGLLALAALMLTAGVTVIALRRIPALRHAPAARL